MRSRPVWVAMPWILTVRGRIHAEGRGPQGSGIRARNLCEDRAIGWGNHAFHGRACRQYPVQAILQPGEYRAIAGM